MNNRVFTNLIILVLLTQINFVPAVAKESSQPRGKENKTMHFEPIFLELEYEIDDQKKEVEKKKKKNYGRMIDLRKVQPLLILNFLARPGTKRSLLERMMDYSLDSFNRLDFFKPIGQNDINNMLTLSFPELSTGCTDAKCILKVMTVTGTRFAIKGSIHPCGKKMLLDMQLIDAKKETAISKGNRLLKPRASRRTIQAAINGIIIDLLQYLVPQRVLNNTAKRLGRMLPNKLGENKGGICVNTKPTGAKLALNGFKLKDRSPTVIDKLPEGEYLIEGFKKDISASLKLSLSTGYYTPIKINLKKRRSKTGKINISTDPTGVAIYLDNKFVGQTPMTLTGLKTGRCLLELKKDYYLPIRQEVIIDTGKIKQLAARMERGAIMEVTSTPKPAKLKIIRLDSQKTWTKKADKTCTLPDCIETITPAHLNIREGKYKLKLEKETFLPREKEVSIQTGELLKFDLMLKSSYGSIEVVSINPQDAELLLDGKPTPKIVKKKPGKYMLEVKRPGYLSAFKMIKLDPAERELIVFNLLESSELSAFKKQDKMYDYISWGMYGLAIFLTGTGGYLISSAGDFDRTGDDYFTKYNAELSPDKIALYRDKGLENYSSASSRRTYGYSILTTAGLSALGGFFTWYLKPKNPFTQKPETEAKNQ